MDDEMDLYGDLGDNGDVVQGNSKDDEKLNKVIVKSSEKLDNDKNKVQNKPSDEEMYDYLYGGQNNVDDIYDDILNPEANKTMLSHIRELEEKVKKSEQHMALLKSQIAVLTNLNKDLREKNINCEKNLSSLKVTARTEINRKNEQITSLRRELDDVLFRRSARNVNKKELEDILSRHKSSSCAGCTAKIRLPIKRKEKPKVGQDETKDRPVTTSGSPNDVCVGNRQVPTKKKRRICVDNLARPQQSVPEKKIKLIDEGGKNDTQAKIDVVGKVPNGGIKKSNELLVKQANSRQSGQSERVRVAGEVKVDLIKKYIIQKPANRKSSKLNSDNFQNSPDSSVVSSDKNAPCSKPNVQKPNPDSDLTKNISKYTSDTKSSQGPNVSSASTKQNVDASLKTSQHLEKNTNEGSPVESIETAVNETDDEIINSAPKSPEDVSANSSPAKSIAWDGSSEYLEITPDLPIKPKPELVKSTFGEFVKGRSTPLIVKASNDSSVKPVNENLSIGHSKASSEKASMICELGRKSRSPERRQRPNKLKKSNDKLSSSIKSSTSRKSPEKQSLNETPRSSKIQSHTEKPNSLGRHKHIDKSGAQINDSHHESEKSASINDSHNQKVQYFKNERQSSLEREISKSPTRPTESEKPRSPVRKSNNEKQRSPARHVLKEKKKSPVRQSFKEKLSSKEMSQSNEKAKSPGRQTSKEKPTSMEEKVKSPVRQPSKEKPTSIEKSACEDQLKPPVRQPSKEKQTTVEKPACEEKVKSPVRQPSKEKQTTVENPACEEKVKSPVRQSSKEKPIFTERAAFDEKNIPASTERPSLKEIHKTPGITTETLRQTSPRRKPEFTNKTKENLNSPIRQLSKEKQSLTENTKHIERPRSPVGHAKTDRQKSPLRQSINDTTNERNPLRQSNQVKPRPAEKKSHNESLNTQMRPVLPQTERQKSPLRQHHNEKASVKQWSQVDSRSTERPSLTPEKQVASRQSEHETSSARQLGKHKPRSTERSAYNDKSRSPVRQSIKKDSPVRDLSKEKPRSEEKPTLREYQRNVENEHQRSPIRKHTNEIPRSLERPSQKTNKSPERQTENEKANRKINGNSRERHASNGSSGTNDNLDNSRWWCDECEISFLTRELLRQHRRDVQCKMRIRRVQAPPRKKSIDLEDVLQINAESGDFLDFSENTIKSSETCSSMVKKQGKQNYQISGCQENKSNNTKVKLVETLKPSKKLDRQYVIPKVSSTTTDNSDTGEGSLDLKNKNKKESKITLYDDRKRDRSRSRNRGRSGERCKSGDRARIRSGDRGKCGDRGKSGERGRSRSRDGRRKRSSGKRSRSRKRSPRQRSASKGRRRPRSRTGSRSRGNRRCRSRSQMRKSSMERLRLLSRKSQSLSPPRISNRRQRKVANTKDLRKQPNKTKKEEICNEDSLEALERMRNDVWAKLAAMEDEEEGEVVESEDELEFSHMKPKDSKGDRTRTPSGGKMAKKLPHLNSEDPVEKENQNKSRDISKESGAVNERNSDKEIAKERRKNTRARRKGLGRLRDSSCSISADDLHEVSTEDLDNKLIPFKKRQFKELQFEAKLIQAKLEEARRSKSNTPVHTTEGYAIDQIPIITESSFAGIKCHRYDSPQPSTYENPPTVSHQNLPINVSNEELLAALENMPKVSPIKLSLTGVEVRAPSDKSTSCPLDLMDSASGPSEVTTSVACEPDSTYEADDNATFHLHQQSNNTDYKVLVQDLEVSESEPDSPFPDRTPLYETNYSKSPLKSISSFLHPPKPLSPCKTLSPWRKPPMKSPQSTPLDLSSPSKSKMNHPLRSTPITGTLARPLDFTSPEGISNLLKSPIVASNPINTSGASPTLPDNIRKLNKVIMATENDENALHHSGNIQVTKVVPKETRNISSPIPPVIQEDSSRDSVASTGSAKKKRRKLGRSQVSSV